LSATERTRAAPALLSGSSVYLASNLVTAVLAFALLPVLTRYLSPSEYGEAAMFATLVGGLGAVVGLNAVAASARRYYDGLPDTELARYVASCLQILVVTDAIALGVVLALREPLSGLLGLETRWLAWSVPVAGLAVLIQLRQAQWQVRSKSTPYAALQSGEAVTVTLLSLLLVVGLSQGAAGRIGAMIASSLLIGLLALVLLRRSGLLRIFAWDPGHVRDALAYGVPLVPHAAAGFVLVAADRLVVTAELGLAQAGIYLLAAHLAQAAALLFDAINKAYVPWLFERLKSGDAHLQRRIVRYTYAWFAVLLAGALLAFVAGPWVVRVVAGERYAAAGNVIGWLVLGQVFAGMYLMVTNYVFYARRTGLLSAMTLCGGVVNVILLVILTPRLGMEGAAIAFSVAMAVRFLLTWWAAHRSHPMPWFAVLQGSRGA
jgi:O-antigen/teichoic acid export membrane protein